MNGRSAHDAMDPPREAPAMYTELRACFSFGCGRFAIARRSAATLSLTRHGDSRRWHARAQGASAVSGERVLSLDDFFVYSQDAFRRANSEVDHNHADRQATRSVRKLIQRSKRREMDFSTVGGHCGVEAERPIVRAGSHPWRSRDAVRARETEPALIGKPGARDPKRAAILDKELTPSRRRGSSASSEAVGKTLLRSLRQAFRWRAALCEARMKRGGANMTLGIEEPYSRRGIARRCRNREACTRERAQAVTARRLRGYVAQSSKYSKSAGLLATRAEEYAE